MNLVSRSRCCTWFVLVAAAAAAGCASDDLAPSIWPPADFSCVVEEMQLRDGAVHVERRFHVDAMGVVVYGTSSRSVRDPESNTVLPVFDRLVVYQLVPACVRAFARRLERLGVETLDTSQGERGASDESGLVLHWRAFGNERTILARGRVHGPMAEILEVVTAHMPPGERLSLPGFAERTTVPVLRGVPEPRADLAGALQAYDDLVAVRADHEPWLLDAFALACAAGDREQSERLLQRWRVVTAESRRSAFEDPAAQLDPAVLQRMLPQ